MVKVCLEKLFGLNVINKIVNKNEKNYLKHIPKIYPGKFSKRPAVKTDKVSYLLY